MDEGTSQEEPADGGLTEGFVERWRTAAYNCFSSGHKFCREVCPVMQVTRDEAHTPTAFHANVVGMEQGVLGVEDIARDYVHCTQCGACELRCPNTLFTGDFYRFRTRTVDLVKAVRALAVDAGIHQPGWRDWNRAHRRSPPRAGGQRHAGRPGARGRLGGRASTCRWAARPCCSATARPPSTAPRCPARSPASCRPAGSSSASCASSGAAADRRPRWATSSRRAASPSTTSPTGARAGPSGSSRSTRTTTSRSPRTTRRTSATTSTSRSCWRSSWWPRWSARAVCR